MTDVTDTLPRHFPGTLFCGPDGHLYFNVGSGNSRPIVRVEPDALKEVGRFGEATSWLSNTTTSSVLLGWLGMVSAYAPEGRVDFLLTGSIFNDVGLLRADDMSHVWGAGERLAEARVRGVVGGLVAEGIGEGWLLGSGTATSHTSLALYRLRVTATAGLDPLTGATIGVELAEVASFAPGEIEAGATGFYQAAGGLTYDATDDSVIFQVTLSEGGVAGTVYTLKWRSGDGMVWKTAVPLQIVYDGPFFSQSRLTGQHWTLMRGDRVVQLDTATGVVVRDELWPSDVREAGPQVYDAVSDTLLVGGTNGWAQAVPRSWRRRGREPGDHRHGPLPACRSGRERSGHRRDDGCSVPGYLLGRQATVRSALEPLAQAFFFDAVESDDRLAFRLRGREPVATIDAQDLLPMDERTGEAWRERRTQELELPERVSVVHIDKDADYGQGTQSAKRVSASSPAATTGSRHQLSLQLPIVLDATTAKRIAERTLVAAWLERSAYEAQLPPDRLALEPTDVDRRRLSVGQHLPDAAHPGRCRGRLHARHPGCVGGTCRFRFSNDCRCRPGPAAAGHRRRCRDQADPRRPAAAARRRRHRRLGIPRLLPHGRVRRAGLAGGRALSQRRRLRLDADGQGAR